MGAPNQVRDPPRQMVLVNRCGRRGFGRGDLVSDRDRRDEPVTLPRTRLEIAAAIAPVTNRPPRGGDPELQISVDDVRAGPDAGGQLFLSGDVRSRPVAEETRFERRTRRRDSGAP